MDNRPVAFITGASRGIGRGVAIELAKCGYQIAGNSRLLDPQNTAAGILEVKQRVERLGTNFLPVQGDVSKLEDHGQMLSRVLQNFGRIDLLVNNAGIAPEKRLDILEATPASFDQVLATNLRGPFFLTQKIAQQMIGQIRELPERRPSIVFITSISASVSSPSRADYCVSKAGLSMAAAMFADRLAEHGINVYEVRPGIIKSSMTEPVQGEYDRLIQEGLVPQKRWGLPEDVGKAVVALANGSFGYSTGLVVEVSGGMNISRL